MSSSKHNISSPWSQLALLAILAGGALILAAVITLFLPGVHAGKMPTDIGTIKLVQVVSSVILFGLPPLFYALMTFREQPLKELGFRPPVKESFYLLVAVLLFCSFPMEGWLGMINKQLPLPHWMVQMEQDQDKQITRILSGNRPVDLFINLLVVAVIPGIVEEACFRGALQRVLIRLFKSPWTGIIVTGLWFSASHLEFQGFLPRAFLGILLGAAYWYSGSLWTVIIAHVLFNGVQVTAATWYPSMLTENPDVPWYWALLSLVLVVGLLAYMRKRSTVSYAQIYQ
ncbi:MAG TPA: CPBP family intramembrane glutamic endopeptidase, partial [Puia sp.]|jgi:membrane protease YdiL (CAAX protease family)|nr:CPBP family intramembrane glutamic endopeptidase [Puia sp.]